MTETTAAEDAAAESSAANPDKRWYVVHAYSGMEKAVERNLRERIDRAGMQEKFGRILVPTEEVVELKNGKKSVTERRFFPGYVLVEMDDGRRVLAPGEAHQQGHRLRRRRQEPPGADLRSRGDEDRQRRCRKASRSRGRRCEWEVGEMVRVKEGPFTDFNGSVEDVNYEKSQGRASSVTIFGRATPVELDFAQVEKV